MNFVFAEPALGVTCKRAPRTPATASEDAATNPPTNKGVKAATILRFTRRV
jgi:hypothetical protein